MNSLIITHGTTLEAFSFQMHARTLNFQIAKSMLLCMEVTKKTKFKPKLQVALVKTLGIYLGQQLIT